MPSNVYTLLCTDSVITGQDFVYYFTASSIYKNFGTIWSMYVLQVFHRIRERENPDSLYRHV